MSTYKIGEFDWPSVTTIISDSTDKSGALTQWSANMCVEHIRRNCETYEPETKTEREFYFVYEEDLEAARFNFRDISKEALDIGSEVHSAIEYYLKTGKEPEIEHDKVLAGFVAFLEWKDENTLLPLGLEETVKGDHWAGTLDFRGMFNEKLYVIDFKTSKAIYANEMGPQIAAYRSACEDIEGSGILRLDKETGLPEFKDFSKRYEKDLETFNWMVGLYFSRHPRIRKKAGYKGKGE